MAALKRASFTSELFLSRNPGRDVILTPSPEKLDSSLILDYSLAKHKKGSQRILESRILGRIPLHEA
jgi:hypothetical protein